MCNNIENMHTSGHKILVFQQQIHSQNVLLVNHEKFIIFIFNLFPFYECTTNLDTKVKSLLKNVVTYAQTTKYVADRRYNLKINKCVKNQKLTIRGTSC